MLSSSSRYRAVIVLAAVAISACGSTDPEAATASSTTASSTTASSTTASSTTASSTSTSEPADGDLFPDVLEASAEQGPDGTWEISATVSSPYDSAERYADAWRVVASDGTVLGVRELEHDHAAEQPFTRSLSEVVIADDIDDVTIEGRDQLSGWGGQTVTIALDH